MQIRKLSASASKQLQSVDKLVEPVSIVKELLDNALDAGATNVSIEITSDAVGCIVVRDNGTGIAAEDRDLACQRSCTSKVGQLADLKNIGGSSLGFRGEALSNIAEISETLQVTTRTRSDRAAECLSISHGGKIASRSFTSNPVGTCVRVTSLFKSTPVRLRRIQSSRHRCLIKLRHLLVSYALVRSSVRYSLTILKGQKMNLDFVFPLNHSQCAITAVTQACGKDCASQCYVAETRQSGYHLQAVIPAIGADSSKLSGFGQFISIDSRPMSATNGLLKQLTKQFTTCLRRYMPGVKKPFMLLKLRCPSGSYDVNVESLKDDIVFADSEKVRSLAEHAFNDWYPPRVTEQMICNRLASDHGEVLLSATCMQSAMPASREVGHSLDETMIELRDIPRMMCEPRSIEQEMNEPQDEPHYVCADNAGPGSSPRTDQASQMRSGEADSRVATSNEFNATNPWYFSRMNAMSRRTSPISIDTESQSLSRVDTALQAEPNRNPGITEQMLSSKPALLLSQGHSRHINRHIIEDYHENQAHPIVARTYYDAPGSLTKRPGMGCKDSHRNSRSPTDTHGSGIEPKHSLGTFDFQTPNDFYDHEPVPSGRGQVQMLQASADLQNPIAGAALALSPGRRLTPEIESTCVTSERVSNAPYVPQLLSNADNHDRLLLDGLAVDYRRWPSTGYSIVQGCEPSLHNRTPQTPSRDLMAADDPRVFGLKVTWASLSTTKLRRQMPWRSCCRPDFPVYPEFSCSLATYFISDVLGSGGPQAQKIGENVKRVYREWASSRQRLL